MGRSHLAIYIGLLSAFTVPLRLRPQRKQGRFKLVWIQVNLSI